MPLRPSGLRVMHVAGVGIALALLVPLLLLFAIIKLDPRTRSPLQIERDAGLPVLSVMPIYLNSRNRGQHMRRYAVASMLFMAVPVIYGLVYALKLMEIL